LRFRAVPVGCRGGGGGAPAAGSPAPLPRRRGEHVIARAPRACVRASRLQRPLKRLVPRCRLQPLSHTVAAARSAEAAERHPRARGEALRGPVLQALLRRPVRVQCAPAPAAPPCCLLSVCSRTRASRRAAAARLRPDARRARSTCARGCVRSAARPAHHGAPRLTHARVPPSTSVPLPRHQCAPAPWSPWCGRARTW
jgi:hypothetical protein